MCLWSCWKSPCHVGRNMCLWSCWKSPCHIFTSPSCSLREKSSLSVLWWALIICFIYLDTDINSSSVVHNPDIRFIPVWKIQFQLMSSVQIKAKSLYNLGKLTFSLTSAHYRSLQLYPLGYEVISLSVGNRKLYCRRSSHAIAQQSWREYCRLMVVFYPITGMLAAILFD